jgi:hypothetical protein
MGWRVSGMMMRRRWGQGIPMTGDRDRGDKEEENNDREMGDNEEEMAPPAVVGGAYLQATCIHNSGGQGVGRPLPFMRGHFYVY